MMGSLVRFVHDRIYTLMLLLIAGGFAVIVAELAWTNHTDGIQMIGMIAAVGGVVLGLAALFVKGTARLIVAALFLGLSVAGIVGVVEHSEAIGGDEGERAIQQNRSVDYQLVSYRLDEGEEGEGEEDGEQGEAGESGESEESVPPLAPLGLSGLALMGSVVLTGYSWTDPEQAKG